MVRIRVTSLTTHLAQFEAVVFDPVLIAINGSVTDTVFVILTLVKGSCPKKQRMSGKLSRVHKIAKT